MVEHAPGDDRVPPTGLELLEARPDEPVSVGRVGVDAEHLVAERGERRHDAARAPTADLEDARRRRGQVL